MSCLFNHCQPAVITSHFLGVSPSNPLMKHSLYGSQIRLMSSHHSRDLQLFLLVYGQNWQRLQWFSPRKLHLQFASSYPKWSKLLNIVGYADWMEVIIFKHRSLYLLLLMDEICHLFEYVRWTIYAYAFILNLLFFNLSINSIWISMLT